MANVILDAKSLVSNIREGKVGASIVDGVGLVADVAAAFVPFIPGGAGTAIKGIRATDKTIEGSVDIVVASDKVNAAANVVKNTRNTTERTSRAARRSAMRQEGIPTSQQPKSQMKSESGYEYRYDIPGSYGTVSEKSVQQQTIDRSHPGEPHWEAGNTKVDEYGKPRLNKYGIPKLQNKKTKVEYKNE